MHRVYDESKLFKVKNFNVIYTLNYLRIEFQQLTTTSKNILIHMLLRDEIFISLSSTFSTTKRNKLLQSFKYFLLYITTILHGQIKI